VAGGEIAGRLVAILDQLLLVLMIVEILYTVQISFREHALVPRRPRPSGLPTGRRSTATC
jgi:hypothetical protein